MLKEVGERWAGGRDGRPPLGPRGPEPARSSEGLQGPRAGERRPSLLPPERCLQQVPRTPRGHRTVRLAHIMTRTTGTCPDARARGLVCRNLCWLFRSKSCKQTLTCPLYKLNAEALPWLASEPVAVLSGPSTLWRPEARALGSCARRAPLGQLWVFVFFCGKIFAFCLEVMESAARIRVHVNPGTQCRALALVQSSVDKHKLRM